MLPSQKITIHWKLINICNDCVQMVLKLDFNLLLVCVSRDGENVTALEPMFRSQKWREEESLNGGQRPQCLWILRGFVEFSVPGSPRNAKTVSRTEGKIWKMAFTCVCITSLVFTFYKSSSSLPELPEKRAVWFSQLFFNIFQTKTWT